MLRRAPLPQARAVADAERRFTAQAQRVTGLREGELRICCAQSVTTGLLPPILERWSRTRGDVSIDTFAAAGLSPRVLMRTGQTGAAAILAGCGVGVALTPMSALPRNYRGTTRRLSPERGRDVVALRTATGHPLVDAFVAELVTRGIPRFRDASAAG